MTRPLMGTSAALQSAASDYAYPIDSSGRPGWFANWRLTDAFQALWRIDALGAYLALMKRRRGASKIESFQKQTSSMKLTNRLRTS